jgi:hypothetical protein
MRPGRGSVHATFTWSKKKRVKASAPVSDFSRAAAGISLDGDADGDREVDAGLAEGLPELADGEGPAGGVSSA